MPVRILVLSVVEVLSHPEAKIGEPTNIEKDILRMSRVSGMTTEEVVRSS